MSANNGTFFSFPLPLLAPMEAPPVTLSRVIDYCVLHVGRKSLEQLPEETLDGILTRLDTPEDYDYDNEEHRAVMLGCDRLKVSIRGAHATTSTVATAAEAERIVSAAERAHGASPLVFIGSTILWEAKREEMPWRDFTVLCAVNSVIGQKTTPQLIRRSLLIARAAGYKSPDGYGLGLPRHIKPRPRLTENELRRTLNRLEERELFARVQASPRRVYFSKGPREKLLADTVEIVRKQATGKTVLRREQERDAMRKARTEGAPLKEQGTNGAPNENHERTANRTAK